MVRRQHPEDNLEDRYPSHPLTYPEGHVNYWESHKPVYGPMWVCPDTGANVPKDRERNLLFRRRVLKTCAASGQGRDTILATCARSPLYFLNTFCWTYRPKYTCADGVERSAGVEWTDITGKIQKTPAPDAPIITWPAQDEMVFKMRENIRQGGILLADKSREQGATVIAMYMLTWAWLFVPRFSALVISRKADMVDSQAEDSLFGKVDYVIKTLPPWIISPSDIKRTHGNAPFIGNRRTAARLIGETSNKDVGQSLRTTVTVVDEAARFPDGKALMKSISSVSAAYWLLSTPDGPGTEFSKLREHANTPEGSKRITVATLGYWDHPEKGLGRELQRDDTGDITGKVGAYYWETPAFKIARGQATSLRDIRENWLIDHDTSGLLVLDSQAISRMRRVTRKPHTRWRYNDATERFDMHPMGELSLWIDLDRRGNPPEDDNYIIGVDISQGVDQSNSIASVMSRKTGTIVAEFVSPSIDPMDLVNVVVSMGYWFAGQQGYAFVIWERNGPGLSFGAQIVKERYPFLYYQRQEETRTRKKTRRWGWQSSANLKEILFGNLNLALKHGDFHCYSDEGIDDMACWIFDDHGRIVCGSLRDETTGAQARHGDRAIAYGLCVTARMEIGEFRPEFVSYRDGTFGQIAKHQERMFEDQFQAPDPFSLVLHDK